MEHSTLCARALLDSAIHDRNNRFFIDQFGRDIDQYSLSDYHHLLNNLTDRLQLNLSSRGVLAEDVPPQIKALFCHGATLANVQYFYSLHTRTLRAYQNACKRHKHQFGHNSIDKQLTRHLACLSRDIDKLTADTLIELSSAHQINISRLMREIVGEA
ncbi:hypothetical protein AB4425_17255 [Vibrio sp. 10N.261.51.A1]|uniref:hypothetical protein n=1 Tax=unclassified Vibrio TaxID=2614977 RepID=UPI00355086C5